MNGQDHPYTGGTLLDDYQRAVEGANAGQDVDQALEAMQVFDGELADISARSDRYGLAARKARASFNSYFDMRSKGQSGNLDLGESKRDLSGYLIDDGRPEVQRRIALVGDPERRAPTQLDQTTGKRYVDTGNGIEEIPYEWALAHKDALVRGAMGEIPSPIPGVGELYAGAPVLAKVADYAMRAIDTATSEYDWSELPPLYEVPTADPESPFKALPVFGDRDNPHDRVASYQALQDPLKLRAIQEVLGEAAKKGELEPGIANQFMRTAGFLLDFAAVSEATGGLGKLAGAAGKALGPGAKLLGRTAATAEGSTALDAAANVLSKPVIRRGFSTVRDFVGYQLVNDAINGNVQSAGDAIHSGFEGAKEGMLMIGAGQAMGLARTGLTKLLSKIPGPIGEAIEKFHLTAVGGTEDQRIFDRLAKRVADARVEGKSLTETLVGFGWQQERARMVEHMVDSAGMGLVFGAYADAQNDPNYEKMTPLQRTARVVAGLTSPEAIGGAGAFATSVLATTYAHKLQWGKELAGAPPVVKAELDARVQHLMQEFAQPASHERVDAYREAFDAYRARSPELFAGVAEKTKWERELRTALAQGQEIAPVQIEGEPQGSEGFSAGVPGQAEPNQAPVEAAGLLEREPEPRAGVLQSEMQARIAPGYIQGGVQAHAQPIGPEGITDRQQLVEVMKNTGRPIDETMGALVVFDQNGGRPADPMHTVLSGLGVLGALRQPDVEGVVKSLADVWRRELPPDQREKLDNWLSSKGGDPETRFAESVGEFLKSGKASGKSAKLMQPMLPWVRGAYEKVRESGLDVTMPAKMRDALDTALGTKNQKPTDEQIQERIKLLDPKTRGEIYARNRNRPQYVGMHELEILGHELRGGLPDIEPTPAIKAAQAGDSFNEALTILKGYGSVPVQVPPESPEAAKALIELSKGGEAFKARFEAQNGAAALQQAIEAAQRSKAQMREVARDVLAEAKDRALLGPLFEYLDLHSSSDTIPQEIKDGLAKLDGALDKDGNLNPFLIPALGDRLETEIAKSGLKEAGEFRLAGPLASARPWIALGRSPWEFKEHTLARSFKVKRLVDTLIAKRALLPTFLKRLEQAGLAFGGLWQNNAVDSINAATIKSAAMHVTNKNEQQARLIEAHAEQALAKLAAQFGPYVPPASHIKLLNWSIESGAFQRMRGPEDFEKLRAGTGYLFNVLHSMNDVLTQLGQSGVQAMFFAPEQIEKFGGRYRPHLYLKLEREKDSRELRGGRLPLSFSGRNLARSVNGEGQDALQIEDPFTWLEVVTRQEGKSIQLISNLRDLEHGQYAITRDTLEKADPYTKALYVPFTLNPNEHKPGLGKGPALRNWYVLHEMLERQRDPNDPRPKSQELVRLLEGFLNEDGKGGRYVPRQTLWEFDNVTAQLFNPPLMEHWGHKVLFAYEQATRAFRQGLTIGRPKHWTLNLINSVGTNHAFDRVPMWDAARSFTLGQGYYADAMRDTLSVLELAEKGNPKEKPADWTNERWERAKLYHRAFEILNGSTFTGVGLESRVVSDAFSATITPDVQTAALLRDMEAAGFGPGAASQWRHVILDTSRRMSGGMGEFNRRILKMLGSHDAAERARGMANHQAMYQLWEHTMKWAATLRTFDTQPHGISLEQAVRYAAVGTADYANTSPLMRSFNTAYGSLSNPLYRKTEGLGGQIMRALLREAMKGRFWMYQSTMAPNLAATVASHPLRSASIFATIAAVTSVLHRLSTQNEEEEASWQEAFRGSFQFAGAPVADDATLDSLARMDLGTPPLVQGGVVVQDEMRKHLPSLWDKLLRGKSLIFQAPSRGDETRVSTTEDLAPGYGTVLGVVRGAQNFAAASPEQKAQQVLDLMSLRSMELSILAAHGAFGLTQMLASDGPEATRDALKGLRGAFGDLFPTLSPMFLASRDGQRMAEVTALDGQSFDDYVRGILQVDQPTPQGNVEDLLVSTLWRSQRLVQPRMGGLGEREALDGMLGELFPGASPARGEFWDKLRDAQSQVHFQLSEILSGTYKEFVDWGRSNMTYDAMLVPALLQKEGPMHRFLEQERDPEKQKMERDYFTRFVTSPAWKDTLGPMMQVARERAMKPDYFRQAMTNAMRDPTGQALLNWIDQRVVRERPDPNDIENLATVFFRAVKAPKIGTVRFDQWSGVVKKLRDYGYTPDMLTDNAAEALRRMGKKPELSGLPALREAALRR